MKAFEIWWKKYFDEKWKNLRPDEAWVKHVRLTIMKQNKEQQEIGWKAALEWVLSRPFISEGDRDYFIEKELGE